MLQLLVASTQLSFPGSLVLIFENGVDQVHLLGPNFVCRPQTESAKLKVWVASYTAAPRTSDGPIRVKVRLPSRELEGALALLPLLEREFVPVRCRADREVCLRLQHTTDACRQQRQWRRFRGRGPLHHSACILMACGMTAQIAARHTVDRVGPGPRPGPDSVLLGLRRRHG